MSFNIEITSRFKRQAKHLLKKYPSLKKELEELISTLEENPLQGIPLSSDCYKIRMSIASKGKGKSGGARVITHLYVTAKVVYLLTIYDKAERENISDKELKEPLKDIK